MKDSNKNSKLELSLTARLDHNIAADRCLYVLAGSACSVGGACMVWELLLMVTVLHERLSLHACLLHACLTEYDGGGGSSDSDCQCHSHTIVEASYTHFQYSGL